uniref:Uncharacterized protein n=1 Tax=Trypanosoma congolense (strain IL3000) TaxID=1068625 RepID=G0UP96_TRYCI|nr:conserved hypothetical protein [Trypanosoma congolense IL3000]
MNERQHRRVPAATILRDELKLLEGLIKGQGRRRVYRHHTFFREAIALYAALRRALPQFARCGAGGTTDIKAVAGRLLRSTIRCAERATVELRALRVDTISLALFLLAITSRVGCVLCAITNRHPETFGDLCRSDMKFQVVHRRPPSKDELLGDEARVSVSHCYRTIGDVLGAAAGRHA